HGWLEGIGSWLSHGCARRHPQVLPQAGIRQREGQPQNRNAWVSVLRAQGAAHGQGAAVDRNARLAPPAGPQAEGQVMSQSAPQRTLVDGDPLDAETVAGAFQRTVTRYPYKLAIQTLDGSTQYTWSELAERVRRTAAGLASFGIGPGDTVAIVLPNTIDCHVIDYAAVHI